MRAMFLEDDDEGVMGLFATHPPVGKRIEALSRYAGGRVVNEEPAPVTQAPQPVASQPRGPWGNQGGPSSGTPGPWN
jgi:heat shock protein HtpX